MRRLIAIDMTTMKQLYECDAPDCERLTLYTFCCVWCEYAKMFGRRLNRHTSACTKRKSEHAKAVLRIACHTS